MEERKGSYFPVKIAISSWLGRRRGMAWKKGSVENLYSSPVA
jgi:hypothetical protein